MVWFTLRFDSKERELPMQVNPHDRGIGYMAINEDKWDIQYTIYYPSNPAIGVFGNCFWDSPLFGYHKHDLERITLLADGTVHLSAHGHNQGTWTHVDNLELDDKGRYVVYVARGSHAMYPSKGKVWRAFGFANDVCDGKGAVVELDGNVAYPAYDYYIADGFRLTKSINYPTEHWLTPVERFLMPLTG